MGGRDARLELERHAGDLLRLLRDRHRFEQARRDRIRAELEREPDVDDDQPVRGTPAGDSRKLRGIPAIGRGVSGAIEGTRPP